jgi:DNA helicase IV
MQDKGRPQYLWTKADLPIIAETVSALRRGTTNYAHILVDEAQDLTRMECKVLSRLVKGKSLTLLGDVNQATKPGALGNWEGIFGVLGQRDFARKTLEQNYRVPESIFDYASSYLSDPFDPSTLPSSELEGGRVEVIELSGRNEIVGRTNTLLHTLKETGRVAVICEDRDLFTESAAAENVQLLAPEESKGLEFDHSIIVMPGDWYDASATMRKLMYVVLTRATKSVTILQTSLDASGITPIFQD